MARQILVAGALLAIVLLAILPNMLSTTAVFSNTRKLRVVLLSVDAIRFDHLISLATQGLLPNVTRMLSEGAYAELESVYPTATAVNHAAASTGAPPGVNGITGNSIHLPGTLITSTVSGFSGYYLLSEPLWIAAERQGLKAIVASFPQSTPPAWNTTRSILFNIYDASAGFTTSTLYTTNTSVPRAVYINFTPAVNWSNVEKVLGRVSAALESTIRIGDTTWYLYLADIDGNGLYDKLVIAPEKDLSKAYTILSEGEWSKPINTTVVSGGKVYTIAPLFKALRLNPLSDFRLYRGLTRPFEAPWFNNEEVARAVWNNVVVRTGTFTDGDYTGLANGWFDEETYMETVYFTHMFFKEFTLYMLKNYDWDLLMTYTPIVDNVYHQFLGLTDPSMPYYNPQRASYYWNLIVRTYKMVDEFIGELISNLPENTALVVISDHGQAPVKKIVYINGILYNNGYIAVDSAFRVVANGTKAYAVWSGQIFVNFAGREASGVVSPGDYEGVVLNITRLLRSYRDPETGDYVFDIVATRNESLVLGLGSARAGDIVVAVKPGYTISTALVRDPTTGRAVELAPAIPLVTVTGDHGPILPFYKELKAVFLAYGPGIKGGYLGAGSILQVAPTIAKLLGIEPPRDAAKPPLPALLEVTTTKTQVVTSTLTTITTSTVISTTTARETTTYTTTVVKTSEVTTTATQTLVQTTTQTKHVTETVTEKVTTPVTEAVVDWTTTSIVGVVALLVGLAVGVLVKRK